MVTGKVSVTNGDLTEHKITLSLYPSPVKGEGITFPSLYGRELKGGWNSFAISHN
jgi:hypothetical protein